VVLRAKIVLVEAKEKDFGTSGVKTTTKDESIFTATKRYWIDFLDFCIPGVS